jgi:hypothetical protein
VVALVALSFLAADVRKRIAALLAADTSDLPAHDIALEATWADKFRDANIDGSKDKTKQWHFVDIVRGNRTGWLGRQRTLRTSGRPAGN